MGRSDLTAPAGPAILDRAAREFRSFIGSRPFASTGFRAIDADNQRRLQMTDASFPGAAGARPS
jgi:hypothetical protein